MTSSSSQINDEVTVIRTRGYAQPQISINRLSTCQNLVTDYAAVSFVRNNYAWEASKTSHAMHADVRYSSVPSLHSSPQALLTFGGRRCAGLDSTALAQMPFTLTRLLFATDALTTRCVSLIAHLTVAHSLVVSAVTCEGECSYTCPTSLFLVSHRPLQARCRQRQIDSPRAFYHFRPPEGVAFLASARLQWNTSIPPSQHLPRMAMAAVTRGLSTSFEASLNALAQGPVAPASPGTLTIAGSLHRILSSFSALMSYMRS